MRALPIGLLAALPLLVACVPIRTIDARAGLEALYADQSAAPNLIGEVVQEDIEVWVVTTPSVGGVLVDTSDESQAAELGRYRCTFFCLDEGEGEEQIRTRADKIGRRSLAAIHVEGFADALTSLLRRHLSRHFRSVKVHAAVRVDTDSGIVITPATEYYEDVWQTSNKRTVVKLATDGATTGQGTGEAHVHQGHLVWAVPTTFISAVTVPVGIPPLLISQMVLRSLESDAIELSLARALDAASRDLAKKLAERPERPVSLDLGAAP